MRAAALCTTTALCTALAVGALAEVAGTGLGPHGLHGLAAAARLAGVVVLAVLVTRAFVRWGWPPAVHGQDRADRVCAGQDRDTVSAGPVTVTRSPADRDTVLPKCTPGV